MPPLRPGVFPRYRGYVCPSCTVKLQSPRIPPWIIRNATTKSNQEERQKSVRQQRPKNDVQLDENLMAKFLEQIGDEGLGPVEKGTDREGDDIEVLRSRIEALEADIRLLKAGGFPTKDLVSLLEEIPENVPTQQQAFLGMLTCAFYFGNHDSRSHPYS
jgi:transposase